MSVCVGTLQKVGTIHESHHCMGPLQGGSQHNRGGYLNSLTEGSQRNAHLGVLNIVLGGDLTDKSIHLNPKALLAVGTDERRWLLLSVASPVKYSRQQIDLELDGRKCIECGDNGGRGCLFETIAT